MCMCLFIWCMETSGSNWESSQNLERHIALMVEEQAQQKLQSSTRAICCVLSPSLSAVPSIQLLLNEGH